MEKSLKVLSIFKKILCILCPIIMFVGCFLHIAYTYTNEDTKLALMVIVGFAIGVSVLSLLNISSQIIKYILKKKNKESYEAKSISKYSFVNKIYNFLLKYENFISIVLNIFILIPAILTICLFSGKGIGHYWKVYYYINIIQWAVVLSSMIMLIFSKNKKSFIVNSITSGINLALTITMCVFADLMMFGKIGAYTNTLEYNILLMVWSIIALFNLGFISANGKFEEFKTDTNYGLGALGLFLGFVCYYFTHIAKRILSLYTEGERSERLFYLDKAHIVIFILLGICIALFTANIIINIKRHVKKKNWFGVADLLSSITGVVLALYGVYTFTRFLMYI